MVSTCGTSDCGSRKVGSKIGKSEIDDTHLVMDLERGIQKVRTVRRMPVEFRWNAEMLQDIRVHALETHTREICTTCRTKHVQHGEND